jgi:endonuclease YncB( thermonuclease family)
MTLKRLVILASIGFLLAPGAALAQDIAPAPRKMPRTPVHRQALPGKTALPPNHTVTGSATMVDSERLRIGDVEMRLFGIVPPSLSASFGPQARAALDAMTASGATTCTIRDRERDGRFLATCHAQNGSDLALELLRRGLAATARGSLQPTELAGPYQAAEQAAQTQKLGLWSVALPRAVSDSAMREANVRLEAANAAPQPSVQEAPGKEKDKAEAAKTEIKPESMPEAKTEPVVVPVTVTAPEKPAKAEPTAMAAKTDSVLVFPPAYEENNLPLAEAAPIGFFERYQLLLTGLLMLLTVMGIVAAIAVQRWLDRREEVRSIAAALRGELMAARAVCLARLNTMASEAEDKSASWPRIRTLVFQAYVGRLGLLGAVLARQIASIYGLASDYAAYYNAAQTGEAKAEPVSKQQALQTLLKHIEEVLPRLVFIEQGSAKADTGGFFRRFTAPPPPSPGTRESPAGSMATKIREAETFSVECLPRQESAAPEPLWDSLRRFATEKLDRVRGHSMEDHIPDYTAMSEDEDMEAMTYGIDDPDVYEEDHRDAVPKTRTAG